MTTSKIDDYVRAALAVQGYQLDDAQTGEVIVQFSRIEAIAQTFLCQSLPLDLDAAPVFRP